LYNKLQLPFLETMITQSCNLSCLGCTNYSDLTHRDWVSWDQGRDELSLWLQRIDILDFGIMGGEPLLNPEVRQWLRGIRDLLPNSQIRFTTNGILLSRNLDLIDLCAELGNCVFKITVHKTSNDLENQIKYIKERYQWRSIREYGIDRLVTNNNFKFQVNRPNTFLKTYQHTYDNMLPWDSNPDESFNICIQQTCPLLYKGKIYKCSSSGLIKEVLLRTTTPNWDKWQPYINTGLTTDCSELDLTNFINNFGKPHTVCGQCPSKQHTDSLILHYNNITTKKYKLKAEQ